MACRLQMLKTTFIAQHGAQTHTVDKLKAALVMNLGCNTISNTYFSTITINYPVELGTSCTELHVYVEDRYTTQTILKLSGQFYK